MDIHLRRFKNTCDLTRSISPIPLNLLWSHLLFLPILLIISIIQITLNLLNLPGKLGKHGSLWKRVIAITWQVSKYGVFSGPYFPAFGLEKNSAFRHFSRSLHFLEVAWSYWRDQYSLNWIWTFESSWCTNVVIRAFFNMDFWCFGKSRDLIMITFSCILYLLSDNCA